MITVGCDQLTQGFTVLLWALADILAVEWQEGLVSGGNTFVECIMRNFSLRTPHLVSNDKILLPVCQLIRLLKRFRLTKNTSGIQRISHGMAYSDSTTIFVAGSGCLIHTNETITCREAKAHDSVLMSWVAYISGYSRALDMII